MIAHDFPNFEATTYASQGNALLGIRDSGKTVTAEGLAERLMDGGIPITVIDPIGRWRFLRVPGKGKGYPVVVAGGADGDLPLTPQNAESLIRAAMQNEEAAEFAPQRVAPGQGQVYAEIEKLARMGGNALLGYTLINQRAEEVNKAVLELCDTLILHRQKGRNSLTALSKLVDGRRHKGRGEADRRHDADAEARRGLGVDLRQRQAGAHSVSAQELFCAGPAGDSRCRRNEPRRANRHRIIYRSDEGDACSCGGGGREAKARRDRGSYASRDRHRSDPLGGPRRRVRADRANLADRVGMTVSGGTFQTYLSRLKSNGLIEVQGRKIKASDALFIDGGRA